MAGFAARLDLRPAGATSWSAPVATALALSVPSVGSGTLATLNSAAFPDGAYEVRLAVTDTLGLTGTAITTFIVDNQPPYVDQTSPALVTAITGGNVFTTNAGAHLYFPPRSLVRDAIVTIAALASTPLSGAPVPGAEVAGSGYGIDWGSVALERPAILELSTLGVTPSEGRVLAIYAAGSDSVWYRLGGTVENGQIRAPIQKAGRYAIYADVGVFAAGTRLSALTLTPRVFGPSGPNAAGRLTISFTLVRAGTATVRLYARSGRVVREIASGVALGAGANVVRWDGRDGGGSPVEDGLYLVTVEALGEKRTQTIAVVR